MWRGQVVSQLAELRASQISVLGLFPLSGSGVMVLDGLCGGSIHDQLRGEIPDMCGWMFFAQQ